VADPLTGGADSPRSPERLTALIFGRPDASAAIVTPDDGTTLSTGELGGRVDELARDVPHLKTVHTRALLRDSLRSST
jgi:hypothetical protein